MEKPSFIEVYHLEEVRQRLPTMGADVSDLEEMLDKSISLRTRVGDCEVGKNDGLYKIRFSRDNYLERDYNSFVLAPFENRRLLKRFCWIRKNPFISLAYRFNDRIFSVEIPYIQSTNRMKKSIYDSLKSSLGVNPHEFLLAHFISRLSPVLNLKPEINVRVSQQYINNPVYGPLRDRFFDSEYELNPCKERVVQILGDDNTWIKARR